MQKFFKKNVKAWSFIPLVRFPVCFSVPNPGLIGTRQIVDEGFPDGPLPL